MLRFEQSQKYLIWDLETQNLNLCQNNLPWQLGFIICEGEKILEKHEKFIFWKDLNVSKEAAEITHFNQKLYLEKAEPPSLVLDFFESYLNNESYIIIAHNICNFDAYILKQWRETLGKKNNYNYLNRTIDTNSLAKMIKLNIPSIHRNEWKQQFFKFSNYKEKNMKTNLTSLAREFKLDSIIDLEQLHNATNDVVLNFMIWNKLKYMIEI